MTLAEASALDPSIVRTMATNSSFCRLRDTWCAAFGTSVPRTSDVATFWRRFLEKSQSRPGHLRDGWLTGENYDDS